MIFPPRFIVDSCSHVFRVCDHPCRLVLPIMVINNHHVWKSIFRSLNCAIKAIMTRLHRPSRISFVEEKVPWNWLLMTTRRTMMPHNPEGKVTIWFLHRGEAGGRVKGDSSKIQMEASFRGEGCQDPTIYRFPWITSQVLRSMWHAKWPEKPGLWNHEKNILRGWNFFYLSVKLNLKIRVIILSIIYVKFRKSAFYRRSSINIALV